MTGVEFGAPKDVAELWELAYGPKPYLDRFMDSISTAMTEKLDREITEQLRPVFQPLEGVTITHYADFLPTAEDLE